MQNADTICKYLPDTYMTHGGFLVVHLLPGGFLNRKVLKTGDSNLLDYSSKKPTWGVPGWFLM